MIPSTAIAVVLQTLIAITGAGAILLIARGGPRWSRWGYPLGLAGQPLWLWSTAAAEQWGMFALALVYAAVWVDGVRANFGRRGR